MTLVSLFSLGQEICDNGLDDDGDGTIDLNDNDCNCLESLDWIINPSFEEMTDCPSDLFQLPLAEPWEYAEEQSPVLVASGSPDYMNHCGFVSDVIASTPLNNFPDGNGIIQMITANFFLEYASTCLTQPFLAGETYTFSFYAGAAGGNFFVEPCDNLAIDTVAFGLYGVPNCSNVPYPSTLICPANLFPLLGTVDYPVDEQWHWVSITFTPTANMNGLIIGPSCNMQGSLPFPDQFNCLPYMFIDGIQLKRVVETEGEIDQTGSLCTSDLVLSATNQTTGGETYQWYKEGVAITGEVQPDLNVSGLNLGEGTYQVVVTSDNGCITSEIEVSQEALTINAPDVSTCEHIPVTLMASGAQNYNWSPSEGLSSDMGAQVEAIVNETQTYTVEGTMNGCVGTETVTVTVFNSPAVNTQNQTTCHGIEATLSVTGAETYSWSPPTGLSSTHGTAVQANPTETTIYTVIGTDQNGCTDTAEITLTVLDELEIVVTDVQICAGEIAELNASGADSYTWTPATGLSSTTGATVFSQSSETITYTVTGNDNNGCSGSSTGTLTVVDLIPYDASVSPTTVMLEEPLVTLSVTSGNEYTWIFEDGSTSNAENFDHLLTQVQGNQEILLIATSADGCQDSTLFVIVVKPDSYVFVPNTFTPDGDELNNVFRAVISGSYDLYGFHFAIYDRWGELIWESYDYTQGWDGTYKGKLAPDGVYSWILTCKNKYNDDKDVFNGHIMLLK